MRGKYLLMFNSFFLIFYNIIFIYRIVTGERWYFSVGDFLVVTTLWFGVYFTYKLRFFAASNGVFAIFPVVFLHQILLDYIDSLHPSYTNLFVTISILICGSLYVILFGVKFRQVVVYFIFTVLTVVIHALVIFDRGVLYEQRENDVNIISVAAALIVLSFLISLLGMRLNKFIYKSQAGKYSSMFDNLQDGFALLRVLEKNGKASDLVILEANPAFKRLFYFLPSNNLTGLPLSAVLERIVISDFPWLSFLAEISKSHIDNRFTLFSEKLSKWYSFHGYSRSGKDIILFIQDVTPSIISEKTLSASLEEKHFIIQELHHRVKNNLQIISSLMRLKINDAVAKADISILDTLQKRISAMAVIHELLYQKKDYARINFHEAVDELIDVFCREHSDDLSRIKVINNVKNVFLHVSDAIQCSQIIYECVSNSFNHAFSGGGGEIIISMHEDERGFVLEIKDDGSGLSKKIDFTNPDSPGMMIIYSSLSHLKGQIRYDTDSGFRVTVIFSP
ncbi:MAG: sensor histidine kinase [Spirochaetes bacterium]|nr:sensor histidine kinase [Spirochaetota bacterium]